MADLGRNDPCHCGSGKKYKKCHLEADEAGARAAGPASKDEVMLQVLGRLKMLLLEHDDLRPLRFDPEAFERELDAATPEDAALAGMSEEAAEIERERVVRTVVKKLLTPELLLDAVDRFGKFHGGSRIERDAIELAGFLAKTSLAGKIAPEEDPLGQLLFEIAIEEGGDIFGDVDPVETRTAALEAVAGPNPPALFRFDEWLRMFTALGNGLRKRNTTIELAGSETAARAQIAQVIVELDEEIDEAFRKRVIERLVKTATSDPEARALFPCIVMFGNEAGMLASVAIAKKECIAWRSDEERKIGEAIWAVTPLSPTAMTPYLDWLTAAGDDAAAQNVRRAQEILDAPRIIIP